MNQGPFESDSPFAADLPCNQTELGSFLDCKTVPRTNADAGGATFTMRLAADFAKWGATLKLLANHLNTSGTILQSADTVNVLAVLVTADAITLNVQLPAALNVQLAAAPPPPTAPLMPMDMAPPSVEQQATGAKLDRDSPTEDDSAARRPPPPGLSDSHSTNGHACSSENGTSGNGQTPSTYSLAEIKQPLDNALKGETIRPLVNYPAPPRPDYGKDGRAIKVVTNFSKITAAPSGVELRAYHYDVAWDGMADQTMNTAKTDERKGFLQYETLMEKVKKLTIGSAFGFDGYKNLYTLRKITWTQDAADAGWEEKDSKYELTIGKCGHGLRHDWTLTLGETTHDLPLFKLWPDRDGRPVSGDRESLRGLMSVLDVVLKQDAVCRYRQIGDAFYDERREAAWAQIDEVGQDRTSQLWFGYRQSIVMTDKGPMMQQDRAATLMLAPIAVLEFICKKLHVQPDRLTSEKMVRDKVGSQLTKGNRLWAVKSRHDGRTSKCLGIDDRPLTDRMFTKKGRDGAPDIEMSVADYFAATYSDCPLQYPHLPGLLCGTKKNPVKSVIPLELCQFLPGQPSKESGPDMAQIMITKTCAEPPKRFMDLQKISKDCMRNCQTAADFGIHLGELEYADARILPPFGVYYKDRSGAPFCVNVDTQKGQWSMRGPRGDLAFQKPGAGGLVLSVNFGERRDTNVFVDFLRTFGRMSVERGIRFDHRSLEDPVQGGQAFMGKAVEDFLAKETSRFPERPALVVCLLPGSQGQNNQYLHPAIKRWHAKAGIPTQCVNLSKLKGKPGATNPQYAAGVLLKVNLKLGGENVYGGLPRAQAGIPLLAATPTMIIGADVHHPPPGSSKPSYAAMCASLDYHVSKYHTMVNQQPSRTEVLVRLEENVAESIKKFVECNGEPPKRIIFFRDGVAHNQFGTSKDGGQGPVQQEIGHIFSACRTVMGDVVPQLVFIVVQKRNRCRIATSQGSSFGKVAPGTVVDCDITEGNAYDFYLVPHFGLKGTPQPSHFHVLWDDAKLSPDELQNFTYQMCHTYARATKIVSRPAPVYYAHLAAFQAQFYNPKFKGESDNWETGSTMSAGSGSEASTASDVQVHDMLKSILHFV